MVDPYIVFDVETNALESFNPKWARGKWKHAPEHPHTIHCLVTRDLAGDAVWAESEDAAGVHVTGNLYDGFCYLQNQARKGVILVGHNITRFDLPALEHHYGSSIAVPGVRLFDTKEAATQMFFSTLMKRDITMVRAAEKRVPFHMRAERGAEVLPRRLWGAQKLEAWGYRLGLLKGSPVSEADAALSAEERFKELTPTMVTYCRRDVELTEKLFHYLLTNPGGRGWPNTPLDAMLTESLFSWYIGMQERNGVGFDSVACKKLVREWEVERAGIEQRLRATIPAWYAPAARKLKTPKRTQTRTKGEIAPKSFAEGASYQEVKLTEFNPGSGAHVADRLITLYGWKPTEFTQDLGWIGGALRPLPSTKGEILEDLIDIPVIPDLVRWNLLDQRIGQASEGAKSWLNREVRERIFGRQNATGARTSRCSHHSPNMNVPKVHKPFGPECRALFRPVRPGWVMLGVDASGLELRMLAHRLWPYDSGAFAHELLQGDVHSVCQNAVGYPSRDAAKEGRYSDLYGCGNEKAGLVFIKHCRVEYKAGRRAEPPPPLAAAESLGIDVKRRLTESITGLAALRKACAAAHKRGYVRLLDGRVVGVDSKHGTLNDLLQGDGMVVMKHAIVRWWEEAERAGFRMGVDWAPMLQVHDEVDPECRPEIAQPLGELFVAAIKWAGEKLGVKCPLDGSIAVGANWCEVH